MQDPPSADQLEITVFGRGLGESIAVHVGDQRWVVVDSFRDSKKRPVAQTYLENLDGDHIVVAVVLTHWDDDHTKGAADLIARYKPAEVWMPAVLDNDEAFEFAFAHVMAEASRTIPSGLREFVSVTDGLPPGVTRYGLPGRPVATGTEAAVRVLSPHDEVVRQGFAALGIAQRPGFGEVSSPEPNDTSIALWVEMGEGTALLGADLEDSDWGWTAIVEAHAPGGVKADVLKVPHHGSPDAHCDAVYERLCSENLLMAVTRYTPGVTPRPSPDDIARLRTLALSGWICGAEGPSKRSPVDIDAIHERQLAVDGLWPFQGEVGMVRLRHEASAGWTAMPLGACTAL